MTSGNLLIPNPEGARLMLAPYRNILAYSYLTIIYIVLFIRADIDIGLVAFYTFLLLSFVVAFFFIATIFTNNIFGINLYYLWTDRLTLFTKSPNHLADFIAPLPFLLLYFFNNSKSVFFKSLTIFLVIIIVLAGLGSESKSTILGWIVVSAYLFLYYIFRGKYARYLVSTVVLFLLTVFFYLQIFYSDSILNAIQKIMDSGDVINVSHSLLYDMIIRLKLIFHAIEAGNLSPVFGLGAGVSSGITEPFLGRESHNHLSEIIMTSGYFGLVSYLGLMFYVFARISIARKPILMSAFIVITVTTMFHFQLRQPLFWFYILFLIYFSSNVRKTKILTKV